MPSELWRNSGSGVGGGAKAGIRLTSRPVATMYWRNFWPSCCQIASVLACSASIRSSTVSGSKRSTHRMVLPTWRAMLSVRPTPPIQKNGMAHSVVMSLVVPRKRARLAPCRTKLPWVCIAPLGSLVVPEVYTATSRSAGVTSASIASIRSSPIAGPRARRRSGSPRRSGATTPGRWPR